MTQIKPLGRLDLTDQVEEHYMVWLDAQAEIEVAFKKKKEAFSKITEILDASASLKKGEVVQLGIHRWLITGTNWHVNKQGVEQGGYYCRRVLKDEGISQKEFLTFMSVRMDEFMLLIGGNDVEYYVGNGKLVILLCDDQGRQSIRDATPEEVETYHLVKGQSRSIKELRRMNYQSKAQLKAEREQKVQS